MYGYRLDGLEADVKDLKIQQEKLGILQQEQKEELRELKEQLRQLWDVEQSTTAS